LLVRELKHSIFLAVCLVALCSASVFPGVQAAETTTVYQINGPSSAVAGSENPLLVAVTVYYNNTIAGDQLVVGILYTGLSPALVPGVVVSSTDPCVNGRVAVAVCAIIVPNSSGVERIGFQIGGIFGGSRMPGSWNLNVTSLIKGPQNNLIPSSVSSKLFKIDLTPVTLNVDVPSNVVVSVDGVSNPAGSVSVGVALGKHNITVPQLINVSQSTRLRFGHWSDGYSSAFRTIMITNSTSLQADYVTQNLLTLVGVEGNATVSNWYDANTNATFSTNQYVPMQGLPGALGVRLSLQGWYENGQLITNSPTGTISMDKPHTLTALWQADYSIPEAITFGVIAVVIIAFILLRRRKRPATRRSRSKRRRQRS
jgi:hypothetical protein